MVADNPVDQLVKEIDHCLKIIDNYPNKRRPFQDLHAIIMKTLPYLSSRQEKRRIFKHTVEGLLGYYKIDYVSVLGITKVSVADVEHLAENPIVKNYSNSISRWRNTQLVKISEIDTDLALEEIIYSERFS